MLISIAVIMPAYSQSSEETAGRSVEQSQTSPVENWTTLQFDPNTPEEGAVVSATTQDAIPERFHGKWAESADHCDIPGH